MGIKDFFEKIKGSRDDFNTRGLDKFSDTEKERIFNTLGTKQAEIKERQIRLEIDKRIERLEERSGLSNKNKPKANLKSKFESIREFRKKNLERRSKNLARQAKIDAATGFGSSFKMNTHKLEVKPFKLTPKGKGSF